LLTLAMLGTSAHALACDPAVQRPNDLITNSEIAVVEGRFFRTPTSEDPNHAIFIVTRVLRGNVGHGSFVVALGGALGSHCEYGEMTIGMSEEEEAAAKQTADAKPLDEYLFVMIYDNARSRLVVPLGWGLGSAKRDRKQVHLGAACDLAVDRFETAVRDRAQLDASLCPELQL
jgi:hypothetical protein